MLVVLVLLRLMLVMPLLVSDLGRMVLLLVVLMVLLFVLLLPL